MTSRRLLENFNDIASEHHFGAVKRPLDGSFEEAGCKVADIDKVHIMATQAPIGRSIPDNIMKLIKNSRSAVLVFRSNESF